MSDSAFEFSDDLQSFIRHEIAVGRFSSPSEVIEAALLLLQEREDRLATLRALITQSERPGVATPRASGNGTRTPE